MPKYRILKELPNPKWEEGNALSEKSSFEYTEEVFSETNECSIDQYLVGLKMAFGVCYSAEKIG